jgi:hypothetical protein
MRNVEVEIRNHLAANIPAPAGVGTRVYASTELPAGYKPSDGAAVLVMLRGGGVDYSGKLAQPVVQVECYGIDFIAAQKASAAVFDLLNAKRVCGGFSRVETYPTALNDQQTEWPFYLSYYRLSVVDRP